MLEGKGQKKEEKQNIFKIAYYNYHIEIEILFVDIFSIYLFYLLPTCKNESGGAGGVWGVG